MFYLPIKGLAKTFTWLVKLNWWHFNIAQGVPQPNRKQTSVVLRWVNPGAGLRSWTRELSSCNQSSINNTARAGERFEQWLWMFVPSYSSLFKGCLEALYKSLMWSLFSMLVCYKQLNWMACSTVYLHLVCLLFEVGMLSLQDQTWLGEFSLSYGRHGLRLPSTKSMRGWSYFLKGWIWLPTKVKGTIDIHYNGPRHWSVTLASIRQSPSD